MNYRKFYPTAIALYVTYFVHGIGASILGQYKPQFAEAWGAKTMADGSFDVSFVVAVIAALGLGRLISLPFSGPISDKFGRRISGLIGILCYAAFFIGIATTSNMYVAYAFAILGGVANSFLDTCVTPSCLEIFVNSGDVANMFTKFSMSIAQFLLPFLMGFVAANSMSYTTIFYVTAAVIIVDGILIAFLPFPPKNQSAAAVNGVGGTATTRGVSAAPIKPEKMKFTPLSMAVIAVGFTCTSTFQLWLNCNQELGRMYGLADPRMIQSYYAAGTMCAILLTSVLLKKAIIKPTQILVLYPAISTVMLLVTYFVQSPAICLVAGFVLGYAAAGGVLQLAVSTANSMYPANKGKITSIVMIASSIANYVILSAAAWLTKAGGVQGPKYVLLFNAAITIVGILLAIYVNIGMAKKAKMEAHAA